MGQTHEFEGYFNSRWNDKCHDPEKLLWNQFGKKMGPRNQGEDLYGLLPETFTSNKFKNSFYFKAQSVDDSVMTNDSKEDSNSVPLRLLEYLPLQFARMYDHRVNHYLRILKDELLSLSTSHLDKPLVQESLKFLIDEDLLYLVGNEVFLDLFIDCKQGECHHKKWNDLIKLIDLTYMKYAGFIRNKIADFYENIDKLPRKFQKEKWKMRKVKRILPIVAPIEITLDKRFAIIKRANKKCDDCGLSIFDNPIDVFQIKDDENLKLVALCDNCRRKNEDRILPQP
jgi:hypothetical protein